MYLTYASINSLSIILLFYPVAQYMDVFIALRASSSVKNHGKGKYRFSPPLPSRSDASVVSALLRLYPAKIRAISGNGSRVRGIMPFM